jgi:DNA-binding transcriptional ArsR family regulator
MALRKSTTIISTLSAKQSELLDSAEAAKETVSSLRSQIGRYEAEATLSTKQAAAVDQALSILTEAGITF